MTLGELSWEKWRASIAVGFAYNKRVFCFPWLNTSWVNDLVLNCSNHKCIDILKKEGSIIIIPTERPESIDYLVDELVYLKNPSHNPSERAREIVAEYRRRDY
jgi:hypothetical protein